jgi:hypothetical protein
MTTQPVTVKELMTRSGARWCEDHERWECAANKPNHHATAIKGMAMCRHHAGKSLDLAKTQGEANLLAWSTQAASEQGAKPLDPGVAVMDQLRVAVLRADIYGELVRLQVAGEDESGLVGRTFAAGRDGARVETGEQVRALVRLEAEWRDRVVRFAKAAHDMGIAERHIELQQAQAAMVVAAFRAALEAGGSELTPVLRDLMLRAFLGSLEAGGGSSPPVVAAGSGGQREEQER